MFTQIFATKTLSCTKKYVHWKSKVEKTISFVDLSYFGELKTIRNKTRKWWEKTLQILHKINTRFYVISFKWKKKLQQILQLLLRFFKHKQRVFNQIGKSNLITWKWIFHSRFSEFNWIKYLKRRKIAKRNSDATLCAMWSL